MLTGANLGDLKMCAHTIIWKFCIPTLTCDLHKGIHVKRLNFLTAAGHLGEGMQVDTLGC